MAFRWYVAWVRLRRFLKHLEKKGEVMHINRPVDVTYEAGAIADLLVKNDGPAVVFEQPRLPDGSISPMPPFCYAPSGCHQRSEDR